jgi:hypothetical protein
MLFAEPLWLALFAFFNFRMGRKTVPTTFRIFHISKCFQVCFFFFMKISAFNLLTLHEDYQFSKKSLEDGISLNF